MFRADLAVDRQAEDPWQTKGGWQVKAGACRRQVLDRTCELLPGRSELNDPAPVRGYARILPAFVQGLWICHLGCLLCRSGLAHLGRKRPRQHVSARAFARVTDKSITLHIADDRMRRDRNVNHFGPALRAHGSVVFWIRSRHRLPHLKSRPERAGVQFERCLLKNRSRSLRIHS